MPFPRPALPFGACEECGASPCLLSCGGTVNRPLLVENKTAPMEVAEVSSAIADAIDACADALDSMQFREREIIKLRYGIGGGGGIGGGYVYTLKEVGRIFSVTPARVREIERRAMCKLLGGPRTSLKIASARDGE